MIKLAILGISQDDMLYGINLISGIYDIGKDIEINLDLKNPDIILIIEEDSSEVARNLINNSNENQIIIANSDNEKIVRLLKYANSQVITFGFNSKSCITTSSISSLKGMTIQICIQRAFNSLRGNKIIEQEFPLSFDYSENEEDYIGKCNCIYGILGVVAFLLVNDVNINDINKPHFEYEY